MKYLASFGAGIGAAILAAVVYALFSPGISFGLMYGVIDSAAVPPLLIILMVAFGVGFFGMLRRASR